MISSPYRFEANLSPEEFQKIGQFAVRWAHIEHTIANCLRVLLTFDAKQASVMIFPLSLETKMNRIENLFKITKQGAYQTWLFNELKPLVAAMQYIRNTILHGTPVDIFENEQLFWHLRSKDQMITKAQLFECDDLINYTGHVIQEFRFSLGDKDDDREHSYTLPDRPPVPDFLPDRCRSFPKGKRVEP